MLYERTALSKKPEKLIKQELAALREKDKLSPDLVFRDPYVLDFLKTAIYQSTGEIKYEEYYAYKSKPIINEIDRVLAKHYGFTDEEMDFIINYDIKSMGRESEDGD
jgi:hypothetical protein